MDHFITIRDFQNLADLHLENENAQARKLAYALKELAERYLDLLHADIVRLQREHSFESGCG